MANEIINAAFDDLELYICKIDGDERWAEELSEKVYLENEERIRQYKKQFERGYLTERDLYDLVIDLINGNIY